MTVAELVVGLVIVAACKVPRELRESPTDVAKSTTRKYAFEAYPQWAAAHPDKECPASIAELAAYLEPSHKKDPWDAVYIMACGPNAPKGVPGMAVLSSGPDGKPGTADDITSAE